MRKSQLKRRAEALQAMHRAAGIVVLPNAWDVISACMLVETGYKAIATTSGGCAFSLGYPDGEKIPRREMVAAVRRIAHGVPVPVSADMEAGYGSSAADVADTVRQTLKAGAVGINIEDGDKTNPGKLIGLDAAVERIRAARAAADEAGIPMVINARTDGFHFGDSAEIFDDAVRRANAYLAAGADCAFVPFVRDGALIGRLAAAIRGPMNVLAGPGTPPVPELARLGVKRVTVGSNITKATLLTIRRAAEELQGPGSYEFARGAPGQPEVHRILAKPGG